MGVPLTFNDINQSKRQYGERIRQFRWKCRGYRQRKQVALLLSALTIDTDACRPVKRTLDATTTPNYTAGGDDVTFAAEDAGATINITKISVGVFTQAIENIATLRADNGASMSRLRFAGEEMAKQKTNLVAAMGRITDVDIAAESTRMAKYSVLVQASAAMLSQANSRPASADAPEVTPRMSKKPHHFKNREAVPQP